MSQAKVFYAVRGGWSPGICSSWAEAEKRSKGVPGASVKKFPDLQSAEEHLRTGPGRTVPSQLSPSTGGVAEAPVLPCLATQPTQPTQLAQPPGQRTYLQVPFAEKEEAKALGARWDPEPKMWYVPAGCAIEAFSRWPRADPADAARRRAVTPFSSAAERQAALAIDPDELSLYTDGACKGNRNVKVASNPAGWGVVVVEGAAARTASSSGEVTAELFGPVILDAGELGFLGAEVGSNNTGELSAICEALLWLRDHELSGRAAAIFYDSEYAAKITQKIYNAQKNKQLAKQAQELYVATMKQRRLRFVHVKGHAGHRWNEAADVLANRGAAGERCRIGRFAPGTGVSAAAPAAADVHPSCEAGELPANFTGGHMGSSTEAVAMAAPEVDAVGAEVTPAASAAAEAAEVPSAAAKLSTSFKRVLSEGKLDDGDGASAAKCARLAGDATGQAHGPKLPILLD